MKKRLVKLKKPIKNQTTVVLVDTSERYKDPQWCIGFFVITEDMIEEEIHAWDTLAELESPPPILGEHTAFLKWLKQKDLYNESDSPEVMHKSFQVWKATKEGASKVCQYIVGVKISSGKTCCGEDSVGQCRRCEMYICSEHNHRDFCPVCQPASA